MSLLRGQALMSGLVRRKGEGIGPEKHRTRTREVTTALLPLLLGATGFSSSRHYGKALNPGTRLLSPACVRARVPVRLFWAGREREDKC